ncbi:MAG: hypothetical protein HQL57_02825 [Magnetococcales bacterium]|nr:hypothetical protein [Magnetococcales bacterium]MBF0156102.1 hypothetical protein [Magnetococcales bacterium]
MGHSRRFRCLYWAVSLSALWFAGGGVNVDVVGRLFAEESGGGALVVSPPAQGGGLESALPAATADQARRVDDLRKEREHLERALTGRMQRLDDSGAGGREPERQVDRCVEGDCKNGQGVLLYTNGEKYSGGFRNGLPHGEGTIHYVNGDWMTSRWQDGKRYGVARKHLMFASYYAERDRRIAELRKRQAELAAKSAPVPPPQPESLPATALDKIRKAQAEGRNGCIDGDCTSGEGIFIYDKGDTYVGQWQDGTKHGTGRYTFKAGDWYQGGWNHDRKEGPGVYYFAEVGQRIEATWKSDLKHGSGQIVQRDGRRVKARWEEGKRVE